MSSTVAVISVSGGKDSTSTAEIAMETYGLENCRFVFADTGNEHDLTIEHIGGYLTARYRDITTVRADFSQEIDNKRRYVRTVWPTKGVSDDIIERALKVLHATGNPFLDLCLWKGRFPSRMRQFCTQYLKRIPLDRYLLDCMRPGLEVESWRGLRQDESPNRRDTPASEMAAEGYRIVYPIRLWTAQQVVDFVRGRGIKLNPLYSLGFGRVGCMPCINISKDELLNTAIRFPQYIDKIREWEELLCMAAKRGWTTFFTDSAKVSLVEIPGWSYRPSTGEDGLQVDQWIEPDREIFERLRVDKRIEWAKTSRGGRQFDFIRSGEPERCASMYGLCE
jgi:3'-phosphoadenosine 5'-phosphosulfate sulfotransferase (PAPS reductase)/FAD synthetase